MEGLTGRITFDRGRRYEFRLDVLQLKDTGLKKVSSVIVKGDKYTLTYVLALEGNKQINCVHQGIERHEVYDHIAPKLNIKLKHS